MGPHGPIEKHVGLLRAWHLAILRFALTRDRADRLGVLAIANEMDRLGRSHQAGDGFCFFRKTTAELCTAVLQQGPSDDVILSRYLSQVGDARLHRALTVALDVAPPAASLARKGIRATPDLWRGLPSRAYPQC